MSRLPLTPILEVFPNFYSSRTSRYDFMCRPDCSSSESPWVTNIETELEQLPKYNDFPEELQKIRDMKDYQKLRLVNGSLEIDTRKCQRIRRFLSRDSRWKVLDYLKSILVKYKEENLVKYFIDKLCNTTYKDDPLWITSIKNELSQEKLQKKEMFKI